jgi:hypothetical protein
MKPRKPKWTAEDQAALGALIVRHGAAAVAKKALAAGPITQRGRPPGNVGDAESVWAYVRCRQELARREGHRLTIEGACKLLEHNLKVATKGPHWTWRAIRALVYQFGQQLKAAPAGAQRAEAVLAGYLDTFDRGNHPLPLRLKRRGANLEGPIIDTWALNKLR